MAFNASAILIVRTDGAEANGGGFNPANASMATDLAATSGTTSAPVVTSASYNFVAGDVGARVFVKSGTNWIPGWYTIASVAANAATLTASIGNATLWDGTNASGVSTATGCATTASPTGGTWTVDYSMSAAAAIAYTDMSASTTTYTSAANPVGKNIIGNYINITGGTNYTLQRVEVVSTSGTTATVDKTLGASAGTGGIGNLGGAIASPGLAGSIVIGGNDVFVKSGTYTITSSSANVTLGRVDITNAGIGGTNPNRWEGFGTIPRDGGTAPVISAGAVGTITIITCTGNATMIENITADGNAQTATKGFVGVGSRQAFIKCTAKNCTSLGFDSGANGPSYTRCIATVCGGTAGFNGTSASFYFACEAYANTTHGFSTSAAMLVDCIASANSGASSDGFLAAGSSVTLLAGCVAYNNGRHGFNLPSVGPTLAVNCLAENNAGYGYTGTVGVNVAVQLLNCGAYNNTSGAINATQLPQQAIGFVTNTTGSFFTNPGSGDFSLNATANQGALARATGYPGLMPRGTTTGRIDIGAAQHADPASTGGGGGIFF